MNTIKDYSIDMCDSKRSRKCSISDILDVLNEDKIFLKSTSNKDEGYDSGQTESALSPTYVSRKDSFSSEDLSLNENVNSKDETKSDIHNVQTNDTHPIIATSENEENSKILSLDPASVLLKSENDAVIMVMDNKNRVQYLSTSREKLESFLNQEKPSLKELEASVQGKQKNGLLEHTEEKRTMLSDRGRKETPSKRGRKRVYECSDDVEREDSKRIRNNEACRKFRKSKTKKLKSLFDSESVLIQRNLNLKEEIASLERQLKYIKEKLGMKENFTGKNNE